MVKDPNISGIGGWLLLLILILVFGYPLCGVFAISKASLELGEHIPRLFEQVIWLLFWPPTAIGIFAGYKLYKTHSPESVRFATLALWISGPLGSSVLSLSFLYIAFYDRDFSKSVVISDLVDELLTGVAWPLVGSCLLATAWTLYLKRSVRVRNTYGFST